MSKQAYGSTFIPDVFIEREGCVGGKKWLEVAREHHHAFLNWHLWVGRWHVVVSLRIKDRDREAFNEKTSYKAEPSH